MVPPPDYWRHLADTMPGPQLEQLKELSDQRLLEFYPDVLPPPLSTAKKLLDLVAEDGWIKRIIRYRCPYCDNEIAKDDVSRSECPECGQDVTEKGGMSAEAIYIRQLAPARVVDWVIALHGMNAPGAWQEAFSWLISTTWGRSVPMAVYKYGIVISGVIQPWRRYKLQSDLRDKIEVLRKEAVAQGYSGVPDVIAHSFGTWLFGHLLKDELDREPDQRLKFGRVILTGSILRPDFDWKTMKESGLVDEVLNHYGSKDRIVPLAHVTIWDSGPSGRRGFDGNQVINVRAEGFSHSDFFLPSNLDRSYQQCWSPFLTLPSQELGMLSNKIDPESELWFNVLEATGQPNMKNH